MAAVMDNDKHRSRHSSTSFLDEIDERVAKAIERFKKRTPKKGQEQKHRHHRH
jgi:hypothetical protein